MAHPAWAAWHADDEMALSKQRQNSIQVLTIVTYNMSALSAWHAHVEELPKGTPVVINEMESYPTKLLGREDQVLLAVNNISFQEVKDTQGPVNGWEKFHGGLMEGWKGISFRAMFSLNDGDALAIKSMLDSSRLVNNRDMEIPFVLGETDDEGTLVPPSEIDGIRPASITMSMPYGTGSGMVLRFAYRDYEEDFGDYPSIVIDIALSAGRKRLGGGAKSYTPMMKWDYSVILNSPNGRTPSDSISRRRYDATKTLLRSALAALGVAPVAVGR